MITRTCHQCGRPYQTFPSIRPLFCSRACVHASKRRGQPRPCAQCGVVFYRPPSMEQRFCSKSCATTARNLTDLNPSFHRDIRGERNPMWKHGLRGADNPMYGRRGAESTRWKGGRKVRRDGYVLVKVPDDYARPSGVTKTGMKYALEHRVVMERALGRYLTRLEVIHHKDGNPSNNRLSNLHLFPNQAAHVRAHVRAELRRGGLI